METLVVAAHHRDNHQYYGRKSGHRSMKFGSFVASPSGNFRGINCRTFQSGEGLLPTPIKSCTTTTPASKRAFTPSFSPKTPSPSPGEHPKILKRLEKSRSVPLPSKTKFKKEGDDIFSERWAGPAYSYSPPPSSLPIPNFSLRPKRTASFEMTTVDFDLRPFAKSAPSSPTRERSPSPSDLFESDVSATETLCRILNLDFTD